VAHTFGLRVEIRTSDKEVHFYSGRQYRGTTICRSMDRPESIVGFKIGNALVDELDVMKTEKARHSWRKIIARMRYNVDGLRNGIDVTTTPEGFRFTHEQFVAAVADKPEIGRLRYGIIQASTYDNEANLPDDYIDSLVDTYPEQLIDAYLDGQFVNLTSGTVYNSYHRTRCDSNETIKAGEPLFIGQDFNVTDMRSTVYVQRGKAWHAVDELKGVYDTPSLRSILLERYRGHDITIYPDASGSSRKTVNASTSDIAILEGPVGSENRFRVRAKKSNPPVKDRLMAVNKALESGALRINQKMCPETARCLEQQSYDQNGEPDKSAGFDHQNDATGYPIAYEMPIVKPVARIDVGWAR